MNSKLVRRPKVLVAAHDAGGGEILAAYIRANPKSDYIVYAAGPAWEIFKRERIPSRLIVESRSRIRTIIARHRDVAFLLVGARWYTHIESMALDEAKRLGIHSVVYLDSWVNFRERFFYPQTDWKKNLPDELWVGDEYAQALARKLFPRTLRIKLVKNQYFFAAIKRYRAARKHGTKSDHILFLSDVSDAAKRALAETLAILAHQSPPPVVRVRFHPADNRKRYDVLQKKYPAMEFSTERDLALDLAGARMVIGVDTVALAVAVLCGIRTLCILEPGERIMIPFKEIITIRRISQLRRALQTVL